MSHSTWERKKKLYASAGIRFVAVSSWLAGKAGESTLLGDRRVEVIPNPFPIAEGQSAGKVRKPGDPVRIIFGAARLDDPIKGLPVLKEALKKLKQNHPKESADIELVTFGTFKNPDSCNGFAIPHRHLGVLSGEDAIRQAYEDCDIVVSSSDFETLPGTLIEGQAYGCIPVALDHGGQRDIIEHGLTGWLAKWDDDSSKRSSSLAEGLIWAYRQTGDSELPERMRTSVKDKFGAASVTGRYIQAAFGGC